MHTYHTLWKDVWLEAPRRRRAIICKGIHKFDLDANRCIKLEVENTTHFRRVSFSPFRCAYGLTGVAIVAVY